MPVNADRFLDAKAAALISRGFPSSVDCHLQPATCNLPPVRSGIVNHHVLASDLERDFFVALHQSRPDLTRFIIISPDHFHAGLSPIIAGSLPYQTNGITVAIDGQGIDGLLAAVPSARIQDEPFEQEHGVGALIPFIAAAFPDAAASSSLSVIPIAIDPKLSEPDARALSNWLKSQMDSRTFIVVSSDMSHYLTRDRALANDEQTQKALRQSDARFFFGATDDFTDSGRSIWTVLRALGPTVWHQINHSISTNYGGSSFNTTSYITGFWE